MNYIIYFVIAIIATSLGALTGMGGGIIIKPIMDVMGQYDASTIGVISSITVFSMSIVSVSKHFFAKAKIDYKIALGLALGSVIGGKLGQTMLESVIKSLGTNRLVVMVQNACLAFLIICVFIYMKNKSKIKGYHVQSLGITLLVGVLLGIISSFLGIGGGPINVALIIFVFSYDTKTAAICSIVTILFSQISKLMSVMLGTGFGIYDLSVVPLMVVGAVMGGFIGSAMGKKFPQEKVEKYFNAVQLFVFIACMYNIFMK